MLDHTTLVNRARESRERLGYEVFTENQNSFRLRGRSATLAGKPDLIAVKNGDAVIIDAKTGKPSPSHAAQVLIYMYAVPKALEQYRGHQSFGATSTTRTGTCRFPPAGWTRSSSKTWAVSSVDGWHQRPRPGGYPAGQNAGGVISQQQTARSGWRWNRGRRESPTNFRRPRCSGELRPCWPGGQ